MANFCVWQCCLFYLARPGSSGFSGAVETSQGAGAESPAGVEGLAFQDITACITNVISNPQGKCAGLLACRLGTRLLLCILQILRITTVMYVCAGGCHGVAKAHT